MFLKKLIQIGQSCNKTNKTKQNKQNKQATTFLPKINNLSPILQNLKGIECPLKMIIYPLIPTSRKRCRQASSKKFYLFRKIIKTPNGYKNRIYPSLRLQKFFLLKRIFKIFCQGKNLSLWEDGRKRKMVKII